MVILKVKGSSVPVVSRWLPGGYVISFDITCIKLLKKEKHTTKRSLLVYILMSEESSSLQITLYCTSNGSLVGIVVSKSHACYLLEGAD